MCVVVVVVSSREKINAAWICADEPTYKSMSIISTSQKSILQTLTHMERVIVLAWHIISYTLQVVNYHPSLTSNLVCAQCTSSSSSQQNVRLLTYVYLYILLFKRPKRVKHVLLLSLCKKAAYKESCVLCAEIHITKQHPKQ